MLRVQQVPQDSFLRVIWASRISRCRSDTPIPTLDHPFIEFVAFTLRRLQAITKLKGFVFSISPAVTHQFVAVFGRGLCETICQRLNDDCRVVVSVVLEFCCVILDFLAGRHAESPDVVCLSAALRCDKVRQTDTPTIFRLSLLPEEMKGFLDVFTQLILVNLDIIPDAVCWPNAQYRPQMDTIITNEIIKQTKCIFVDFSRLLASFFVTQNLGEDALHFPSMKIRRPIKIFGDLGGRQLIE